MSVVVDDDMNGLAGWDLGFDGIEDTDAGCLGHGCCRPMGRFPGRIGTGEGHHSPIDDRPAQRQDARGRVLSRSRPSTPAAVNAANRTRLEAMAANQRRRGH